MKRICKNILAIGILTSLCGVYNFTHAETSPQITVGVNNFFDDFVSTNILEPLVNDQETTKLKRNIIVHYCDTILHKGHAAPESGVKKPFGFNSNGFLYDPRQSWFIYALCVNIDEKSSGRKILYDTYESRDYKQVFDEGVDYGNGVKHEMTKFLKSDIDLNEIRQIPKQSSLDSNISYNACNPATTMQACNFSEFVPDIFSAVMNDYSNMKLASLYGYEMSPAPEGSSVQRDDSTMEKAIKQFSLAYFGDDARDNNGKSVADKLAGCNDADARYLYPRDLEGDKKHCSHPKTYEFVAGTIKSAQRLLKKTTLVNAELLMSEECTQPNWELEKCSFALHGNTAFQDDRKTFHNLLLNELYRYNLFLTYYTNTLLLYDSSYYPLTMGSVGFTEQRSLQEYKNILIEQQFAQQALRQTMRMLDQVAVYFPIHVGLAAYYEDLVNYRKTVTSAYTPLHQLNYKFRNVQACMQ